MMDGLGFYVPFNSILVILGQWKSERERLCAMKSRLDSERISENSFAPVLSQFRPNTYSCFV